MEELFGFIGLIFIEVVYSAIGWFCLLIRHRDRKKIEKIKNKEYAGEFGSAGRIFILNFIAGVGAIAMFGIAITFFVLWIYKSTVN
jgi:hypothetical protein